MKYTTIFGFIGRKGSGKDTAANYISESVNEFKEPGTVSAFFAFADPLKNMVCETLGITRSEEEYLKRHPGIKVAGGLDIRSFHNKYGDVLKSRFGKTIFTDITIDRINDTYQSINPDTILVTDVRFPMEDAALKKFGDDMGIEVITIKMINSNLEPIEADAHETEYLSETMPADYTIEASSPQEIKDKIKTLFGSFIIK